MGRTNFDPYREWEEYQLLEEEFLRALRYVPLNDSHNKVWSSPFSNLIINIGSLIDSFFKNIIKEESVDNVTRIEVIRQKQKTDMGIFREVFEQKYRLSNDEIFELRNFSSFKPFSAWATNSANTWWTNYTEIKHDRFLNREKASLENVLRSLGALFLLNVKFIETIPVLVDNGVINTGGLAKGYCKEFLTASSPENMYSGGTIFAKTDLFGYVYDVSPWTIDHGKKIWVLSPSYPGY